MMASDSHKLPRLPACQRCYTRKARCDNERPQCKKCTQSGSICMTTPTNSSEPITRAFIHHLEQKERGLLKDTPNERSQSTFARRNQAKQNETLPIPRSATFTATDYSGPAFLKGLFADEEWRQRNAGLLQNLASPQATTELNVAPNALPSSIEGRQIFDKYLATSNVFCPILLRENVNALYSRVFLGVVLACTSTEHDRFRAYMILAIGSITLHRNRLHHAHPYGYYLSAMQYMPTDIFAHSRYDVIQNLLLITRFGIYHNIGTSIWDINQLCIRMCVERDAHRPPDQSCGLLKEQHWRRLFWECYIIDRYSAILLGKPFAIADRDIDLDPPLEADDELLTTMESQYLLLSEIPQFAPPFPNDMSVFRHCIRLRQISSRMRPLFTEADGHEAQTVGLRSPFASIGTIYVTLDRLLLELDDWRRTCPVFANPKSLYEMADWFDLLHARERLLFIRRAIDLMSKRNAIPAKDISVLCIQAAMSVITVYSRLFRQKVVTHTRSYFQTLFLAGLSMLYCTSVVSKLEERLVHDAFDVLHVCAGTLKALAEHMPDAMNFALVFDALLLHRRPKQRGSHKTATVEASSQINATRDAAATERNLTIDPSLRLDGVPNRQVGSPHLLSDDPSLALEVQGFGFASDQFGGEAFATTSMSDITSPTTLGNDTLSWMFLQDSGLWNMEAGLNEYVYGNAGEDLLDLSAFEFTF